MNLSDLTRSTVHYCEDYFLPLHTFFAAYNKWRIPPAIVFLSSPLPSTTNNPSSVDRLIDPRLSCFVGAVCHSPGPRSRSLTCATPSCQRVCAAKSRLARGAELKHHHAPVCKHGPTFYRRIYHNSSRGLLFAHLLRMVPVLAVTFDSCVVISLGHVVAVAPIARAGFTASPFWLLVAFSQCLQSGSR